MYTKDREGLINNYATEPEIYYAEYPSREQQLRYALLGGKALLFVAALILTAFAAN